jgi:hypothetical protein
MIPASKWKETIDQDIPIKMKEKIKSFFEFKRGLEEKHGNTRSRIINMDETNRLWWSDDRRLMVDRSFFFFFRR